MTEEPKGRIGGAFDDFLKEEGIFEEVQSGALKKVVAHQLGEATLASQEDFALFSSELGLSGKIAP